MPGWSRRWFLESAGFPTVLTLGHCLLHPQATSRAAHARARAHLRAPNEEYGGHAALGLSPDFLRVGAACPLPCRVLDSQSLNGFLPSELGTLTALTKL